MRRGAGGIECWATGRQMRMMCAEAEGDTRGKEV